MTTTTDKNWGVSMRAVIQGLVLLGIAALVGMVIQQGRDQAKADSDRAVQIATLQAQVASVQQVLAGMPDLSQRVMRLETNQAELLRRQNNDDAWRERMQADPKLKGWTR